MNTALDVLSRPSTSIYLTHSDQHRLLIAELTALATTRQARFFVVACPRANGRAS